ncbi:capsid maturation protease [Microbacterium phage Karate]|nr:capsid maturation protease [Microbacterium phage Karate]
MAIPRRYPLLTEMALEQAQANYVRAVLAESAERIAKELARLGSSGNPLTRMQLEAQRAAITAMLTEDFSNIGKSIADGKPKAATAASRVVSRYENQLLAAVMDADAVRRLATAEARRTVNGLEAALKRIQGTSYHKLSDQVYDTTKLATGWVDDAINRALVSGWDAKRLAKEIVPSISPNVPGGVSYAANRLARTEINNAFHAASWDRMNRSIIVTEVDWNTSSSHPENDVCDEYRDASPFLKTKVPEKPHPNCYCYITPRLPSEEEFINNLLGGKYDEGGWVGEVTINGVRVA